MLSTSDSTADRYAPLPGENQGLRHRRIDHSADYDTPLQKRASTPLLSYAPTMRAAATTSQLSSVQKQNLPAARRSRPVGTVGRNQSRTTSCSSTSLRAGTSGVKRKKPLPSSVLWMGPPDKYYRSWTTRPLLGSKKYVRPCPVALGLQISQKCTNKPRSR